MLQALEIVSAVPQCGPLNDHNKEPVTHSEDLNLEPVTHSQWPIVQAIEI